MKISILNKDTDLEENSTSESYKVNKKDLSALILTIKVLVALLYAFGLGYSLFFFGEDYIKVGLKFLYLMILAYIFIDFPLSFLKALLLPKTFDKDKIILNLNPYNLSIDICSNIKISKTSVILSFIIPFIFLAIIPTILSYKLEFNIYLYVLGTVSAIIGTKDLIYSLLILKNYSLGSTIKLTPDEFIFYN